MKTKEFIPFALKVIIAHTLTYFTFGLIMSNIFDYGSIFQENVIKNYMRPIDSVYVLAGPFLQPIRGFLFALGIWPFRKLIIESKWGWLILWNTIVIFGILSTPAAAPSSLKGIIYSKLPLWLKGKLNLYILFVAFWIIDTVIPIAYQYFFSRIMPIHLAMMMGFFPALIIAFSLRFNRKNMIELNLP